MKVEKIIDNGVVLAIIVRDEHWERGSHFISAPEDFQQVGLWDYDRGKAFLPHIHLSFDRHVSKTQEVIFVKKGRLKADIFNGDGKLITSAELKMGDTGIFLSGGHGYEVLDNGTKVLEIKNGPYLGPEKDRRRI